jgi:diacylglycerol O-acyltransferase
MTMHRPVSEVPARRVLVVSADIGGGHHATGRALEERLRRYSPGSQVRWVDTLDAMGFWVGPAFRRTYVANVQFTPWLYEFFYSSLWRHRWFATAAKRFVGAWAGRRLAPVVEGFDPDLILSTYPLGSAGLAWLRQRRGLGVPMGAWISDFAPHPFWVYPELDLNLVVHPWAVPVALAAAPGAPVRWCEPPVVEGFQRAGRDAARRRYGLPPDCYTVLVSCGSLGFGAVVEATRVLADLGGPVRVLVACGRNAALARELAALGCSPDRVRALDWVDDMPTLLRAADLVVTNAGGATALEAMVAGTPILMYRPIAAHGAANAALMAACGTAETCQSPESLAANVRSRLPRPAPTSRPSAPRLADLADGSRDGRPVPDLGLPALAGTVPRPSAGGRRPPSWPMRAQDAFFLHVDSPAVPQNIGAVLDLDARPDGRPLTLDDLADLLTRRLPALPTLRRRPVDRGRWRTPGWVIEPAVELHHHLAEHPAAAGGADDAIDRFWSTAIPLHRPPWQFLLVTGLPDGRTRLAVKVHHCLADGFSMIGALGRLADPVTGRRATAATTASGPAARAPRPPLAAAARGALARAARTARGLGELALAGAAPRSSLNRRLDTPARRLVTAALPGADVSRAARACGASSAELVCALVAEALRRVHPPGDRPEGVRVMFAVSRSPRVRARTHGNWTGAVALDLPLGRGTARQRVTAVRATMRRTLASGQPEAAGLVMRLMGALPAPAHAVLARQVYSSRFANVIASYVPGMATAVELAGAPVRVAVPVVGLADGIRIGVGAMRWSGTVGVGILLDAGLAAVGDPFVEALHTALRELLAAPDAAHPTAKLDGVAR